MEIPYNPTISLLGIYLEKMKILIQKDTHTPMFITALFIIAKIQKQPKCPSIVKLMKNIYCLCLHKKKVKYYPTIKKELNSAICSNMNGTREYYAYWNKLDKNKYHMISLIHGI